MQGNGNAFLAFNMTSAAFTRNVVTGSLGSQVLPGGGVSNTSFTENVIANGSARGIRIGDFGGGTANSSITVRCNSVSGNANAGFEIDAGAGQYTGSLGAAFNWWGSATGPTIASNPGGSGQTLVDPAGQVTFTPFLTSGVDSDPATPGFQCVPRASVADGTIAEGDSGAATVDVAVTLDTPSASTVTVAFGTEDGTATAGSDYATTSGTLTFASGETSKTVSVPVTGDADLEPDETFALKLSAPSNATIADGDGAVTITNNDALPQPAAPSGPSGPSGPAGPSGPVADVTAPLARSLRLRPSSFRAATGTTIGYTLSEAATTTFTVQRAVAGRVSRGRCRRQSRSNRTRPALHAVHRGPRQLHALWRRRRQLAAASRAASAAGR